LDPLLFGMLGSRAMALPRCAGGVAANAHIHIQAIAALCLAVADRTGEARVFVARIRQAAPGYGVADFLTAFRFPPEAVFRAGAALVGLA
jgi:hypothetical protein